MGRLFFGGDDVDFNFLKAGILEPAVEIALSKPGPAITI